jgi:predicted Na+-dependent transporter
MAGVGLSSSQTSNAANESAASFGGDTFNFAPGAPVAGSSSPTALPSWVVPVAIFVPGGLVLVALLIWYMRRKKS